jgi:hypothetical protein
MTEIITFLAVLCVKLLTETFARWSENSYLTHRHAFAAIGAGLTVVTSIPVARMAIADGSNTAAVAVAVAVVITTYRGSRDLQKRKSNETGRKD